MGPLWGSGARGDRDATEREVELADDAVAKRDSWDRGSAAAWLHRIGDTRRPRGEIAEPNARQIAGDWAQATKIDS
jgi:hypothetical protein